VAALPTGSIRKLQDPFADKKSPWTKVIAVILILAGIFYFLSLEGLLYKWTSGLIGHKPAAVQVAPATAPPVSVK
jgi:hypothetical protein